MLFEGLLTFCHYLQSGKTHEEAELLTRQFLARDSVEIDDEAITG